MADDTAKGVGEADPFKAAGHQVTLTADEIAATVKQTDATMMRLATFIGAHRHVQVAAPVADYVFTRAEQIEQAEKGVGEADPFQGDESRNEREQGIAPKGLGEADPFQGRPQPVEWLDVYLTETIPAMRIFSDAERAGYSAQQMKRAKAKLGVRAVKVRNAWYWQPVH